LEHGDHEMFIVNQEQANFILFFCGTGFF
jgi:hypothetical protein